MDSVMEDLSVPGLSPSDEYVALMESMQQLRLTNYGLQALSACLQAANKVLRQGTGMRQQDMEMVRRMFTEELFYGCERCFTDNSYMQRVTNDQLDFLYSTAVWLVKVACSLLTLRSTPGGSELWAGLDGDVVVLIKLVGPVLMFQQQHAPSPAFNPLHARTYMEPARSMGDAPLNFAEWWIWEGEPCSWVSSLLEHFGLAGGFNAMGQLLMMPDQLGSGLLCALVDLAAGVVRNPQLKDNVKEYLYKLLASVAQYLQQLAAAGDDQLTDGGTDRTYRNFHWMAVMLWRTFDDREALEAVRLAALGAVQAAQRIFIQNMLSSNNSTYNKVLSGVRECQYLLHNISQAGGADAEGNELLQDIAAWMEENDIVQRMLRSNLHQRQYTEQVGLVLAWLTKARLLTSKHIDMIWAVTEQEDAYEAVRTNVYDMLSALASAFSPEQLDMLFSKFGTSNQEQSLLDSTKRAQLLLNLAQSEANSEQYIMQDKILSMMSELVMPSTAPPELLARMVDVINVYFEHTPRIRSEYMDKCEEKLRLPGWHMNYARLLEHLIRQEVTRDSDEGIMGQEYYKILVEKICSLATEAAPGLKQLGVPGVTQDLPSDGVWSYDEIMQQYCSTLTTVADCCNDFVDWEVVSKLWSGAVVPLLRLPTQDFLLKVFGGGAITRRNLECYFDVRTNFLLLDQHIVEVEPQAVTQYMLRLFNACFTKACQTWMQVGKAYLVKIIRRGVDFLWQVYLQHPLHKVANTAMDMLMHTYKEGWGGLDIHVFVSRITEQLRTAAGQLDAGEADASRAVLRCLNLAQHTITAEACTMPPVPAHVLSWQGNPVVVDVALPQGYAAQRTKLACHSNQYIGLVRFEVARLLGCAPNKVRMFAFGKEWQDDGATLGQLDMRSRGAVVTATECGAPNSFTQLPSEYRPEWEANSKTWMLTQQPGLYPLLLHLVDHPTAPELRASALRLLEKLPTCPELPGQLRRALLSPQRSAELLAALTRSSSNSSGGGSSNGPSSSGGGGDAAGSSMAMDCPFQALYSLQALTALLFPSFQQELFEAAEAATAGGGAAPSAAHPAAAAAVGAGGLGSQDEPMAEANGGPHEAADGPGAAPDSPADANAEVTRLSSGAGSGKIDIEPAPAAGGHHSSSATAAAGTAGAACSKPAAARSTASGAGACSAAEVPFTKQQLQQLRRLVLQGGCLEVVRDVAVRIAASCGTNLTLLRQLAQLLVLLIQHLMDSAQQAAAAAGIGPAAGHHLPADLAGAAVARSASGDIMLESPAGPLPAAQEQPTAPGGNNAAAAPPAAANTAANPAAEKPPLPPGTAPLLVVPPSSPSPESMSISTTPPPTPLGSKQTRDRLHPVLPSPTTSGGGMGQAGGSGGGGVCAASAASSPLPLRTAQLLMDVTLQLAVSTSQLWGNAGQGLGDTEDNQDVALVAQALMAVWQLLELQPLLLKQLLGPGANSSSASFLPSANSSSQTPVAAGPQGSSSSSNAAEGVVVSPLVSQLLLCPHYSSVRSSALHFLGHVARLPGTQPQPLAWLLQQLAATRRLAAQRPAACSSYYDLFSEAVALLPTSQAPAASFQLAEALLDEEVAALQHPEQQQRQLGGSLSDEDGAGDAEDVALQGRLHLLLTLVRSLDRRSVGVGVGSSLIKLLLTQYLFPEAQLKLDSVQGKLDLAACAAQLVPRCSATECRTAAFELLLELTQDSVSSLEEAVRLILQLHADQRDHVVGVIGEHRPVTPRAMREPGQYMGLRNGGATCYMNAVVQQLFMQPRIRQLVLAAEAVPPEEAADNVFAQLQGLFANLALNKAACYLPNEFWRAFKDYDGQPIDVKEHQDAYEFFTRLQDYVDQHLISSRQLPAIQRVMGGRFVQQVICRGHDFKSEREEDFYQISVDVRGMGTLEKSLENYVQGELLEGDNAYYCEELGKRVTAVKRTCIRQLPHTLCVHLKRFEFDFHTQTRYKVRDRFEFPHTIDMFRYTVDGLALQEQQAAAAAAAEGPAGVPAPGAARRSSATGGASSSSLLGGDAPGGPQDLYDLKGVVVHMGSAFTGHYYSYIKERPHWRPDGTLAEGSWLCFDDKQVQPWSISQLEQDCFGGRAAQDSNGCAGGRLAEMDRSHSAYMLFYERRSEQAQDADALTSANPTPQAAPTAAQGDGQPASATAAAAAAAAAATGGVGYAGAGDPAAGGAAAMEVSPRPSTTAATEAAPAAAGGGSAPEDMDISVPEAAAAGGGGDGPPPAAAAADGSGAAAAGFVAPYGMPLSLYSRVMNENIHMVWLRHVFDRDYFRFIRVLLCHSEVGHAASKKSRRKESGSDTAAAAAATAVAAGGAAAPGSQAAAAGEAPGDASQQPADLQQRAAAALGPSASSRVEQEAAAGLLLTELGLRFSFDIFLHAGNHVKGELQSWLDVVTALLRGPTDCMVLALDILAGQRPYVDMAFRARFNSISDTGRDFAYRVLEVVTAGALQRVKSTGAGPVRQALSSSLCDLLVRLVASIELIGQEELEVLWMDLGRVVWCMVRVGQVLRPHMHRVLTCTNLIGALVMLLAEQEHEDLLGDGLGPLDMKFVYMALRYWLYDCENWPNLVCEYNQQPLSADSPFCMGEGCPYLSAALGQDGASFTISSDVFTALMDKRLLTRLVHDLDPSEKDDQAAALLELLVWGNLTASEQVLLLLRNRLWNQMDPDEMEEFATGARRLVLGSGNRDGLQGQRAWVLFFQPCPTPTTPFPVWTSLVRLLTGRRSENDEQCAITLLRLLSELCQDEAVARRMHGRDALCQESTFSDVYRVCEWLLNANFLNAEETRDVQWLHDFNMSVYPVALQHQHALAAAVAGLAGAGEDQELDEELLEGGQAGLGGGDVGSEGEEEDEEVPEEEEEEDEEEDEDSLQENNG